MQFRLRTLLIVLAVAVAAMVALTDYKQWAAAGGLVAFFAIFGVWYWMLLTSQKNPKFRCFDPPPDSGV